MIKEETARAQPATRASTCEWRHQQSTAWSGDVTGSVAWTYNSDFNKILETVNGASGSAQAAFGYDADQLLTCASPTTCTPPGSDALQLARNTAGLVSNITLGSTSENLFKTYCVFRIAAAYHLSGSQIWNLVTMRNSDRLLRSFAGYEVVLLDYAVSAAAELAGCAVIGVVLATQRGGRRRQSAIVDHVVGGAPPKP